MAQPNEAEMKKRLFHRGHNIENASGAPNGWKTTISGNTIISKLSLVKKSIDWWYDMQTFMPPEKFIIAGSREKASQKVEDYKGFKLINDNGDLNGWYVILGTKLLKGSPTAIKKHLDLVITKMQKK
ncbi:DUF3319 domain-containing protein [Photobacterium sp. ZSDE20]|uniref:DUF3319 domain-containing protein n=1 Tax=Photobacterium pectinilyticum TaxID=2906793 RepID=A0ABT1MWP8_9GAMM|nr:DUF3319 domain-containing protein [Photobacterium sp. ZSDE20]MCQ1056933.1 DUF3319 domain-containing protein [Photobacterium sp. ZSDE20]MDD1821068.1 DUF3319 domain-containing protein [Photobacterium sp. ZSDE20]